MNNSDIIKQSITMYDVLDRCGLSLNRHNSMCCPLHREKTPSFKVYKDGSRFKCFGCGIGGDVITFAMQYYSLNYGQAIMRLASEFNLSITGARTPTAAERIKAAEERRAKKREAEERKREYDRLFDAYYRAYDELFLAERLVSNEEFCNPKTVEEFAEVKGEVHYLYCEAIKWLPYWEYEYVRARNEYENFNKRG